MPRSTLTVAALLIAGGVFLPACNRPATSPPQPAAPDPRVQAALAAAEAARDKAAAELDAARRKATAELEAASLARRAAEETLAAARLVAEQARSGNIQALYPSLRPMPAIAADYSHRLPLPPELAPWASDIRFLDDLSSVQVTWELSGSDNSKDVFEVRLRLFDETGAYLDRVTVPTPMLRPGDRLVDRVELDPASKARWHGPARWYSLETR